uniref:Putative secreted protein n=1 Tax=Anopheles marajoara TaxID=58244 RepID=A0A2M4CE21_9DIPT
MLCVVCFLWFRFAKQAAMCASVTDEWFDLYRKKKSHLWCVVIVFPSNTSVSIPRFGPAETTSVDVVASLL